MSLFLIFIYLVFYLVIYHALLIMLSWSYWQTIFAPTGSVPKQVSSFCSFYKNMYSDYTLVLAVQVVSF